MINKNLRNDMVNNYFDKISNEPLLGKDEERKLLKEAKEGNIISKHKLISSNLKLVVSIAKKYNNENMTIMDCIQEGNLGLIKAIENFDLNYENRFSTYATHYIQKEIRRALSNKSRLVRIPVRTLIEKNEVLKAKKSIEEDGKESSIELLSIKTGFGIEKVKHLLSLNDNVLPISKNDDELDILDIYNSDYSLKEYVRDLMLKELMNKILDRLSKLEREVIEVRYGLLDDEPKSYDKCTQHLPMSKETIRKIEKSVLDKIRLDKDIEKVKEMWK